MKILNLFRPIAFAVMLLTAGAASATPFNFSYTLESGDMLTGMLEGELQMDNDTVIVSEVTMAAFNNVAGPALPIVTGFILSDPTVSLSGTTMELCAFTSVSCGTTDGFLFSALSGIYAGGPSFGGDTTEAYSAERWSLTPKVPEPGTLALFGLGLAGLGFARRRKARAA